MEIKPLNKPGKCLTGYLVGMTAERIVQVLGFSANVEDDPSKVVNSWGFTADGHECGIWDYKGSHEDGVFSVYGPDNIFRSLFGDNFRK